MDIKEQRIAFGEDRRRPSLVGAVIAAVSFIMGIMFISFGYIYHFSSPPPTVITTLADLPVIIEPASTPEITTELITPSTAPPPVTEPSYRPQSGQSTQSLEGKINSDFAIFVRCSDGFAVAELAADERMYPASMTKIMTLILITEYIESGDGSFDDEVEITWEIIKGVYDGDGANISLQIGERAVVRDLIYATMLPSACDASAALAWYVAGNEENFARLMNKKAAELGMTGSNFVNSSGLYHKDHYSTARDVATMLTYALNNSFMKDVMMMEEYTLSSTNHHSKRSVRSTLKKMLSGYSGDKELRGASILGGKTGTLDAAGKCLASFGVNEDGEEFLMVSAKASSSRTLVSDLYYVYSNYT